MLRHLPDVPAAVHRDSPNRAIPSNYGKPRTYFDEVLVHVHTVEEVSSATVFQTHSAMRQNEKHYLF